MIKEGAGSYGGVAERSRPLPDAQVNRVFCPSPVSPARSVLGLFHHPEYCLIEDTGLPHQSFNSEFLQNSATPCEAHAGKMVPGAGITLSKILINTSY